VPTRWARSALCALAIVVSALFPVLGAPVGGASAAALTRGSSSHAQPSAPLLSLASQTPWVTADAPGFDLALAVSPTAGDPAALHLSVTFYGRLRNPSQFEQAVTGTPSTAMLLRLDSLPVTRTGDTSAPLSAATCVDVLPDANASAGTTGCPAGSPTLTLGCTPLTGTCGDVYPVTASLVRDGSATPLARVTTFVTYQEPSAIGRGGPLRVGLVLPVNPSSATAESAALASHRAVATTLAVAPAALAADEATPRARQNLRPYAALAGLGDEVVEEPYVPVNLAALSQAGIAGEIGAQLDRGDQVLRTAGFKPTPGLWVDTGATFSQGDAANLAAGLQEAGATRLVLSDTDLSSGGLGSYTFAQPFTLDLGHGSTVGAAAADSTLDARFAGNPGDPVLAAEQLVAGLSFVHFENAYLAEPRGVVVVPPSGWQPSGSFLDALLAGLTDNPALAPVTVSQLLGRVPAGGNGEPAVRHLQAGTASHGITRTAALRIADDRQQLASFAGAVGRAPQPAELTTLGDRLLATEAQGLSASRRGGALTAYARSFGGAMGQITLATERTVTFTSNQAAIPVTVLSAAPYPVNVVVTLTSDKFLFPNGSSHQLVLDRPTTSWRFTATARTSGDRLPIEVTVHTPDGQLLIAHTVLTVQATSISFVGVALTAVAGAVLLVWWVRTWRRARRRRPRPVPQAP
jgi:hypothetical protein